MFPRRKLFNKYDDALHVRNKEIYIKLSQKSDFNYCHAPPEKNMFVYFLAFIP